MDGDRAPVRLTDPPSYQAGQLVPKQGSARVGPRGHRRPTALSAHGPPHRQLQLPVLHLGDHRLSPRRPPDVLAPSGTRLRSFEHKSPVQNTTLKDRLSRTPGVAGWKALGEVDWGRMLLRWLELLLVQKKFHQVLHSVGHESTAGSL